MNLYSSLNQYFEITSPNYNIFWAIFIADFLTFNTSAWRDTAHKYWSNYIDLTQKLESLHINQNIEEYLT
jgi:hypothetical protein